MRTTAAVDTAPSLPNTASTAGLLRAELGLSSGVEVATIEQYGIPARWGSVYDSDAGASTYEQ